MNSLDLRTLNWVVDSNIFEYFKYFECSEYLNIRITNKWVFEFKYLAKRSFQRVIKRWDSVYKLCKTIGMKTMTEQQRNSMAAIPKICTKRESEGENYIIPVQQQTTISLIGFLEGKMHVIFRTDQH